MPSSLRRRPNDGPHQTGLPTLLPVPCRLRVPRCCSRCAVRGPSTLSGPVVSCKNNLFCVLLNAAPFWGTLVCVWCHPAQPCSDTLPRHRQLTLARRRRVRLVSCHAVPRMMDASTINLPFTPPRVFCRRRRVAFTSRCSLKFLQVCSQAATQSRPSGLMVVRCPAAAAVALKPPQCPLRLKREDLLIGFP